MSDPWSSAISAGASHINIGLNSIATNWQNHESWDQQMEAFRMNQIYQEQLYNRQLWDSLYAENRAEDRWYRQQDYLRDIQQQMLDYVYKKYDSPTARAKALRAAGFNPSAMLQNAQGAFGNISPNVGAASPIHGNAPAGVAGVPFQAAQVKNPLEGITELVPSIANAIEKLSNAKNKDMDTEYLIKTLTDRVRSASLQADGLEIANTHSALLLALDKVNLDKRQKAEIKLTLNRAFAESAKGHHLQASEMLIDEQTKMQRMKNFEEQPYAANMLELFALGIRQQKAAIENLRGQTYMFSQSGREMQLRNDIQETQNLIYGFTNIEQAKHAVPERLRRNIQQAWQRNLITQADAEAANKLLNRMQRYNNLDEWQKDAISITDYIMDKIGGAAGAAAGAYVGARTPRKVSSPSQGAWNSFEQWVHSK